MMKLIKLSAILFGFALAFVVYTEDVNARYEKPSGGCVGNGYCGVTANGTHLIGKWEE